MVRTRSQLENLSKEELIEELITVNDITSKISDLTNRFDDFLRRFEVVSSELAIARNCNRLLTERVVQLERNAVTNAQYHRRESVEVNPVPPSISNEEPELNICQALSLTGHEVKLDDLQACHRLKKKESVIVKFKCRKLKQKVLINRKNLRNKSALINVSSSYRKACAMKTISWHINIVILRIREKSTLLGSGIML